MLKAPRQNTGSQVFDILRVFSFLWIVWAHSFVVLVQKVNKNIPIGGHALLDGVSKSWMATGIMTGFYAVDYFLFMGGYVCIIALSRYYSMFKHSPWWKFPFIYMFAIIKRYARIMPCYLLVGLFEWKISHAITYGPLQFPSFCSDRNFWNMFNILSVNNFQSGKYIDYMCLPQAWYLVVDFQLYMTVPVIVMVHMYNKTAGMVFTSLMILTSIILSLIYLDTNKVEWDGEWAEIYYSAWDCRGCVYWMGCLLAQYGLKPMYDKPKKSVEPQNKLTADITVALIQEQKMIDEYEDNLKPEDVLRE